MRKFIIILAASILVAGWIGCEKYTSGYDANPLLPVDANALKTFVGAQLSYVEFTEGFPAFLSAIWSQQIHGADRQFSAYDVYSVNNQDFSNDWFLAYTRVLANLKTVEGKMAGGDVNLKGAAEILEGLHMGTVAAVWGDVPYSEAAQPTVTTTPKYDPQLEVYAAAQQALSQGITDFTSNSAPLAQDVLTTGGSSAKWIKLAHSAKARYLIHTARSQGYSAAVLNQVISEAQLGITSLTGADDVFMTHGQTYGGNMNLWYSFMVNDRSGYMDASGNFAYAMMKAKSADGKSDESGRLAFYYTADGSNMNLSAGGAFAVDALYPAFRASETHLLMAEAYARLGNAASALTELNNARTYNNNVFGNNSQPFIAGDFPASADLLQAIFNETYLSLMCQIEAWNFLRRIDYAISYRDAGATTHTMAPKQGTQFPQRFVYSDDELTANPNKPAEVANAQFVRTAANQ